MNACTPPITSLSRLFFPWLNYSSEDGITVIYKYLFSELGLFILLS